MSSVFAGFAALLLIAALAAALEGGRRLGRRHLAQDPVHAHTGLGATEGAVFALLGLLLAFMFSGSWSRFDARRELIVREANAIGTAWLRLDLFPAEATAEVRAEFRRYAALRLALSHAGATEPSAESTAVQQRLWLRATELARTAGDARGAALLLPALNDWFDVATIRHVAAGTHPPRVVFLMLLVIALAAAALAGYGMAPRSRRSWLHIVGFLGSLLAAIYVSFEMEFPRRGFIRVDAYDQLLVDTAAALGPK